MKLKLIWRVLAGLLLLDALVFSFLAMRAGLTPDTTYTSAGSEPWQLVELVWIWLLLSLSAKVCAISGLQARRLNLVATLAWMATMLGILYPLSRVAMSSGLTAGTSLGAPTHDGFWKHAAGLLFVFGWPLFDGTLYYFQAQRRYLMRKAR